MENKQIRQNNLTFRQRNDFFFFYCLITSDRRKDYYVCEFFN